MPELKDAPKGTLKKIVSFFTGNQGSDRLDAPSADWEAMNPYWEKVGDIVQGQQAMKDAGRKYLPQFPHESDKDYEFRLETAKFTNVYRDIVEGLSQKPFSKEITIPEDAPSRIQELIEDIDGRGNHLNTFAGDTFFNGINKAIDWILVDYAKESARTAEEERERGSRPYWVHIPADNVLDVQSAVIDGREQLQFVKIREAKGRIREYIRGVDEEGNPRVIWQVLEETDNPDAPWVLIDSGEITIGVIPMVPFITGRRKGNKWVFNPPMQDAADLQIELYQQETALKHIKTMTGYPMLAGNGVNVPQDAEGKPKPITIGPAKVLYAPTDGSGGHGEWSWIEPTAENMRFLKEDIEETKKDLRELGRQPLTANSANLTVVTTAFAAQKGNSAVQQWAFMLKDALENALHLTGLWLNIEYEPEVTVFTDFGVEDSNDEIPKLLLEMRVRKSQDGEPQLSQVTFWEEMKRRGILSAEFDPEEETKRLLNEVPGDDFGDTNPDG